VDKVHHDHKLVAHGHLFMVAIGFVYGQPAWHAASPPKRAPPVRRLQGQTSTMPSSCFHSNDVVFDDLRIQNIIMVRFGHRMSRYALSTLAHGIGRYSTPFPWTMVCWTVSIWYHHAVRFCDCNRDTFSPFFELYYLIPVLSIVNQYHVVALITCLFCLMDWTHNLKLSPAICQTQTHTHISSRRSEITFYLNPMRSV
jgi:hypothetical protein